MKCSKLDEIQNNIIKVTPPERTNSFFTLNTYAHTFIETKSSYVNALNSHKPKKKEQNKTSMIDFTRQTRNGVK